MDINDLIAEEGEEILKAKSLKLKEEIDSLAGIDRFQNIEDLMLFGTKISNYSPLNSYNARKGVKWITLASENNLTDISFLQDYSNLERLWILACQNLNDFSALKIKNLRNNLQSLSIMANIYNNDQLDISFLEGYCNLNDLELVGFKNIRNQKVLYSLSLRKKMFKLELVEVKNIYNPSFLKGFNPYPQIGLQISLKDCSNIEDISCLKDEPNIKSIIISGTSIRDISDITEYECVKQGNLLVLNVPESLNWFKKDKFGRYVNEEAIRQLIRMGVTVQQAPDFIYRKNIHTKEDDIRLLLARAGLEDESIVSKVKGLDVSRELEGGFSSNIVVSSKDQVIKISDKKYAQIEQRIYSLTLPQMKLFMPDYKDALELDNISLMVLENVENSESGFAKSRIQDPILHNLYIMGLFHNEATKEVMNQGVILNRLSYQTLNGEKHYDSIVIPLSHFSPQELREFRRESPQQLVKEVRPIIDDVNAYILEEADTVVHGDWKLKNTVNGHILDFGVTHWGKEIEDIGYFLSEMSFNLSEEQIDNYTNQYIKMRCSHDKEFLQDTKKKSEIRRYMRPIRLKELSIRAGVRRKRDQTPKNATVRGFYLEKMKQIRRSIF